MSATPTAILAALAEEHHCWVVEGLARTHTGEVHQAWEGDGPVICCIDDVATIQLEEQPTSHQGNQLRNITHQQAISEPLIQLEHNGGNGVDWLGADEALVSIRPRENLAADAREFSVFDVGNGLKVKAHRDVYCNKQEHSHSVDHQSPLNVPLCAVDWIEQCAHAPEE